MTWIALALLPSLVSLIPLAQARVLAMNDFFLLHQDIPIVAIESLLFLVIAFNWVRLPASATRAIAGITARQALMACIAIAFLTAAVGFTGWWLVYHQYPLSMDEFWAQADAVIFQHGRPVARIPEAWRPFAQALQPEFRLPIAGNEAWISIYLPMHSALRAFFGVLGSQALEGPFWAGLSVMLTYGMARRYWPDRPDAALVAAVLLATSSQLVITAMSPYAMSAHLALNLAWLWLLLRKSWPSQVAAAVVAFAACGLHQLIFHPLFAAPFVLQLWLQRQWPRAVFHTITYALIGLFWMSYWPLMLGSQGLAPAASAPHTGTAGFLGQMIDLIRAFRPDALRLMAQNLLRFASWQNPLAIGLGVAGGVVAIRSRDSNMAPLVAGIAITVAAMFLLLAYQGHGWGYRYLHGFLGSLCLLATFAWIELTKAGAPAAKQSGAAVAVAAAFAAFVLLPARALQASQMIAPYARAHAAIEASPADVVLVDPFGLWFGQDLVRNDPMLVASPKVLRLDRLTADQVRWLCARYRISVFDQAAGARLGMMTYASRAHPPTAPLRVLMTRLSCGELFPARPAAGA